MSYKALEELQKISIVNWHPCCENEGNIICHIPYFEKQPTSNCLAQHIQIYKLIEEYVELFEDYQKMHAPSGKALIRARMEAISKKLVNEYWIVSKNQKYTDKWTCCEYDM